MSQQLPIRLSHSSLALFTRQLATLLKAGVSLLPALECLERGADLPQERRLAARLAESLNRGEPLSKAMQLHRLVFPLLYLSVIRVGEQTGQLVNCLAQLAGSLEREHRLRQRIRSSLVYPAFVLSLATVLTLAFFHYVLPGLLESFQSGRQGLPWITRWLMALVWLVHNPAFWTVCLALLAEAYLSVQRARRDRWRNVKLWRWMRGLPALGPCLKNMALQRFCAALHTSLQVGCPLLKALPLAGEAAGDPLLAETTAVVVEELREGTELVQACQEHPEVFPGVFVQLLRAGEESATLVTTLSCLERHFEEEAESRLAVLQALVEPCLLVAVSMIVALVVLAIFLPLYADLNSLTS